MEYALEYLVNVQSNRWKNSESKRRKKNKKSKKKPNGKRINSIDVCFFSFKSRIYYYNQSVKIRLNR